MSWYATSTAPMTAAAITSNASRDKKKKIPSARWRLRRCCIAERVPAPSSSFPCFCKVMNVPQWLLDWQPWKPAMPSSRRPMWMRREEAIYESDVINEEQSKADAQQARRHPQAAHQRRRRLPTGERCSDGHGDEHHPSDGS